MSTIEDTITKQKIQAKTNVKPPSLFNVIYINDDVTTMEFVVETLTSIFNHSHETAIEITKKKFMKKVVV